MDVVVGRGQVEGGQHGRRPVEHSPAQPVNGDDGQRSGHGRRQAHRLYCLAQQGDGRALHREVERREGEPAQAKEVVGFAVQQFDGEQPGRAFVAGVGVGKLTHLPGTQAQGQHEDGQRDGYVPAIEGPPSTFRAPPFVRRSEWLCPTDAAGHGETDRHQPGDVSHGRAVGQQTVARRLPRQPGVGQGQQQQHHLHGGHTQPGRQPRQ